jgi:dihydropteroate synthase
MKHEDTQLRLFCRDQILDLYRPVVMGILNLTPDSFYDGGKYNSTENAFLQVKKMVSEGAKIIDIGALSTRPGSVPVDLREEWSRMEVIIPRLKESFPNVIFSVDTYRSEIAKKAILEGVHIINDISGGTMDESMYGLVADLDVPYVLTHIQGIPTTMQQNPRYENLIDEVKIFFEERIVLLQSGFGFGKTVEQNYQLLNALETFVGIEFPILVGLSRKSFVKNRYGNEADQVLHGTLECTKVAIEKGAKILRVHDVMETVQLLAK